MAFLNYKLFLEISLRVKGGNQRSSLLHCKKLDIRVNHKHKPSVTINSNTIQNVSSRTKQLLQIKDLICIDQGF